MNKLTNLVYIIPTYNEKENIVEMLDIVAKILKKQKKYNSKILVVDDNSPDGTGNLVTQMSTRNRSIYLLKGSKNGLGIAIIRGYKYAIKNLSADVIITNESDFSYSPNSIPKILKLIENGADAVFISRKPETLKSWSFERRIIHWVANSLFAKIVAGITKPDDHNSAYKAFRVKEVLSKIDFSKFPNGFSFFNYLTYKVLIVTSKTKEIFVKYTPRKKGLSKISMHPKYLKYFLPEMLQYISTCIRIRIEKSTK